ncbi:hypothetical protein [Aquabacterium sp.]|uniref:hypothetical protein n=1 Tax=Aquabacterium sp. TaxID=1872578 RepID=UPI002C309995|nr:hypothetical protein [Aquabacterium sp.]HSW05918.1 hypothetical protein [Aquabacterium sp.]
MSSRPVHPGEATLPAERSATVAPPFRLQALMILWPAFVMAGVLEMLVFVVVDPTALHWFGSDAIDWPRSAVYSVTFLIFWGTIATSTAITQLLLAPAPTAH